MPKEWAYWGRGGEGRRWEGRGAEGRGGGAPNQPTITKLKRKTRATRPVAGWCYLGDGKGGEGGRHDLLHERSPTVNPAPRPRCLGQENTRWGSGGAVSPPVGCGAAPSPTTGAGTKRSTPSPHTIHRFWTYPLPTLLLWTHTEQSHPSIVATPDGLQAKCRTCF